MYAPTSRSPGLVALPLRQIPAGAGHGRPRVGARVCRVGLATLCGVRSEMHPAFGRQDNAYRRRVCVKELAPTRERQRVIVTQQAT